MAARGFGRTDFQLMLLRRMADYQPGLVEDAVRSLGAPRLAVADAHRRWQAMLRSRTFPGGSQRHRLILGEPEVTFSRRFGDLVSDVARWPLPLWPRLRFETITVPGGPVLQEWLVRPDAGTAPELRRAADAQPWACVVADLDRAFAPVEHEDAGAPSRWDVVFGAAGDDGALRRYRARFAWGLLQVVMPL